jgi:replicative DNA helicase Mcm
LSEAYARLRLSPFVEEQDALLAIKVIRDSWKGLKDPTTGKQDIDMFNVGKGDAQKDRIKTLIKIIEEISKEYGGKAADELIIARAIEKNIKQITTEKEIKHLKESKVCWTPEQGYTAISRT